MAPFLGASVQGGERRWAAGLGGPDGEVVEDAADGGRVGDLGDGAHRAAAARAIEKIFAEGAPHEPRPIEARRCREQLTAEQAVEVTRLDDVECVAELELANGARLRSRCRGQERDSWVGW